MAWIRGAFGIPPSEDGIARAPGITIAVREGRLWDLTTARPIAVYPVDEPDLRMSPVEARMTLEAAKIELELPSFTVLFGGIPFGQGYARFKDVADWVGVNLYPFKVDVLGTPYHRAADWWRLRVASRVFAGRMWFGVPQAFFSAAEGFRLPTPAEFRRQEEAFRPAGAVGVLAYSWARGGRALLEKVLRWHS